MNLLEFPLEILYKIFSFSSLDTIYRLRLVNSCLYNIIIDKAYWYCKFKEEKLNFYGLKKAQDGDNFIDIYKKSKRLMGRSRNTVENFEKIAICLNDLEDLEKIYMTEMNKGFIAELIESHKNIKETGKEMEELQNRFISKMCPGMGTLLSNITENCFSSWKFETSIYLSFSRQDDIICCVDLLECNGIEYDVATKKGLENFIFYLLYEDIDFAET